MANPIEFANYAKTTLPSAINAVQTSIVVADGSVFAAANLGVGHYFYLTLIDCTSYAAATSPPAQREIVKVTLLVGNTLTVVRGQDGTVAQAFAACDVVELRFNAQAARDLRDTGGGGGAIAVLDEGVLVDSAATVFNFTGAGVTASDTAPGVVEIAIPGGGGGSGAPVDATYVTMSLNGTLTQERVLTAGTGITITDGGANSPVTIAATAGGGTLKSQIFTSNDTWSAPTGVTAAWVDIYAGGGGGAGGAAGGGGGGGSGEYCEGMLIPVPAGSLTIVIGAAGTGGGSGATGVAGGNSSIANGTLTWTVLGGNPGIGGATGGAGGGLRGGTQTAGVGQAGTAETPFFFGGSGGGTGASTHGAGGGSAGRLTGGAGGTTSNGGGGGGATPLGTGGAGGDAAVNGFAAPATNTGTGGGGGGNGTTSGGNGSAGKAVVYWIG